MNCCFYSSRPQKDEKFYCTFDEELFIQQKNGSQPMLFLSEILKGDFSRDPPLHFHSKFVWFHKAYPELHVGNNHIILPVNS